MPSPETLIVFTMAALLMNISPGPSNFYVMSRAIGQGAGAGLEAAAGLAAGSLVHVAAAAAGLSAVFLYSPTAYTVIKFVGAAYLVYLGVTMLRRRPVEDAADQALAPKSGRRIFRESFFVEVLNPKTAVFFLAFLPQFVDTGLGAPAAQILVLGLIVTATALPCDALVAFSSGAAARAILRSTLLQRVQNWVSGSILIGLGCYVALARSP